MHLYLAVRGILDRINRWENDLTAHYNPFIYNPDQPAGMLQLSIRPIRIYELISPEMHMPSILRKIQPTQCWNPAYQKYIWMMRKALGLEPLPEKIPQRISTDAMTWDGVDVTAIGLRKDKYIDGKEQL